MAKNEKTQTIDRISPDLPEYALEKFKAFFDDQMHHDGFRKKVQEIITETADSVPFMEKIKKYASDEIDHRVFKSAVVLVALFVIPCVVSVVGGLTLYFILPHTSTPSTTQEQVQKNTP